MKQYVITQEQVDELSNLIAELTSLPTNVHEARLAAAIGIQAQEILIDVEKQPDTTSFGEFS